jgi:hypothetical protein
MSCWQWLKQIAMQLTRLVGKLCMNLWLAVYSFNHSIG